MPRLTSRRARRGFTLVETMVAVTLFGLVMAGVMTIIARQQRFYRGAGEIIDGRSQMRQAAALLPMDLRGVSSIGDDIQAISDSAIQFNDTFGSSVICSASNTSVTVAPMGLSRHTLTSWLFTPVTGDSIFIYDEGTSAGSEDDAWLRSKITNAPSAVSQAPCAIFLTAAEQSATTPESRAFAFNIALSLPSRVGRGTVVRFARPVKYKIYQSAGDSKWYLGYQRNINGTGFSAIEPLAGPFRSYATGGTTNGIVFKYYRADGTQITTTDQASRQAIARVDVTLRGQGSATRNSATGRGGQFSDSLLLRIGVRNRS